MSDQGPRPLRVPSPNTGKFPALRRLRASSRRKRIPFVQQLEWADCGAACLAMVLRYYGKGVRLEEVRALHLRAGEVGVRRLDAALQQLSEEHRVVVLLHDTEGYKLEEIEGMTGIPVGTIKSRLHRARARLRQILQEDGTIS